MNCWPISSILLLKGWVHNAHYSKETPYEWTYYSHVNPPTIWMDPLGTYSHVKPPTIWMAIPLKQSRVWAYHGNTHSTADPILS
jgi:hypothetical protein